MTLLTPAAIDEMGFEWPLYAMVEENAVFEDGKIDLTGTLDKLRSGRDYYKQQVNQAYAFKSKWGADYSDFTDKHDTNAVRLFDYNKALAYVVKILEKARAS